MNFLHIEWLHEKNKICQFEFASRDRNMAFIIAVQSSYFTDDKLQVKEIAVVGLHKPCISHWIISPPCEFSELSKLERLHSSNKTVYEHRLSWTDGHSSIEKVNDCIREITRRGDVYVDGTFAERDYIENIIGRNSINLQKTKIPSFNQLIVKYEVMLCGLHSARCEPEAACALQRALLAQQWFLSLAPVGLRDPQKLNILAMGKGEIDKKGKFIGYDEVD